MILRQTRRMRKMQMLPLVVAILTSGAARAHNPDVARR